MSDATKLRRPCCLLSTLTSRRPATQGLEGALRHEVEVEVEVEFQLCLESYAWVSHHSRPRRQYHHRRPSSVPNEWFAIPYVGSSPGGFTLPSVPSFVSCSAPPVGLISQVKDSINRSTAIHEPFPLPVAILLILRLLNSRSSPPSRLKCRNKGSSTPTRNPSHKLALPRL